MKGWLFGNDNQTKYLPQEREEINIERLSQDLNHVLSSYSQLRKENEELRSKVQYYEEYLRTHTAYQFPPSPYPEQIPKHNATKKSKHVSRPISQREEHSKKKIYTLNISLVFNHQQNLNCLDDFRRKLQAKLSPDYCINYLSDNYHQNADIGSIDLQKHVFLHCIRRDDFRILQSEYKSPLKDAQNLQNLNLVVLIFHNGKGAPLDWDTNTLLSGLFLNTPQSQKKMFQFNYSGSSLYDIPENSLNLEALATALGTPQVCVEKNI
eukprot:TRINITY_DN1682_c0_g1_i2.p1 TRINITY_DN1682_c0_g1~~TRINITY_DN1682_c0_g1_i2.p1  ORF type:complete len:266 (-),score=27.21 TRINITY_DN1682_c0_g1_i2:26-823(-)